MACIRGLQREGGPGQAWAPSQTRCPHSVVPARGPKAPLLPSLGCFPSNETHTYLCILKMCFGNDELDYTKKGTNEHWNEAHNVCRIHLYFKTCITLSMCLLPLHPVVAQTLRSECIEVVPVLAVNGHRLFSHLPSCVRLARFQFYMVLNCSYCVCICTY